MKKLACLLLILTIFASAMFFVVDVHASTPVGGFITSDTTWTRANSPYQFNGVVTVNNGVTLTIEPGVTVDFASWYLQVNGVLNARGTSDNKITLTSSTYSINQRIVFSSSSTGWNEQTGTGSIIENANFDKVYLYISGSPKINKNYINTTYPLTVTDGSPMISNNIIYCIESGVYVTGSFPTISGNLISVRVLIAES